MRNCEVMKCIVDGNCIHSIKAYEQHHIHIVNSNILHMFVCIEIECL